MVAPYMEERNVPDIRSVDFLADFDGHPVDPVDCVVRYEAQVEHVEHFDDRSRSRTNRSTLLFGAASRDALYEAIEGERLKHPSERFTDHRFEYGPVRKVMVIAQEDFDKERLVSTEARLRHLEAEARAATEAESRRVAAVARKEADDYRLYEDLKARFESARS